MSDDKLSPGGMWAPTVRIMALALVEDLLLKGNGPRAILVEVSKAGYTDSLGTVNNWIADIHDMWKAEAAEHAAHRRNLWRCRLEARYRMMLADLTDTFEVIDEGGTVRVIPCFTGMAKAKLYDSIAKLEALAFRLDGLDAPIVIKHEGVIDIRALSPDQRRERIDELIAKRARLALPASTTPPGDN